LLVDPLAVAGWEGMAAVALVGTILIVSLGYITYMGSYINASAKESAQLSVLGITRGAYLLMISTEHLIVGVVGLVIGTFTGLLMTEVAVSSIAHTESGGKLIPPFVLTTEWLGITFVYAAIGIIAVIAAIRLFVGYRRLALTQILRLEE
jgi:ABC-type antimicrobial peptide transport system permease subunit